jgi:thiosulfate/3-mercaptopyruvate sulfurtransferase
VGVLVSAGWLSERVESVRVLDVRGEVLSTEPRYQAYPERYREGHIPGAVFCDWRHGFTDPASDVPVTVAAPERFAAEATGLGIGADTVVVAYDTYFSVLAGRIAWVLRSYGHDAAYVLDGGLDAWRAAGLPLETGEVRPAPADPPHPVPGRLEGLVDLAGIQRRIAEGVQIVDARSRAQYTGEETHARQAGHIPGALSVPYTDLLDAHGRFLETAELERRLRAAGVALDRPLVAYCNGGVSATAVGTAARLAGVPRVEVYDGSWNEWGNRKDTPIER